MEEEDFLLVCEYIRTHPVQEAHDAKEVIFKTVDVAIHAVDKYWHAATEGDMLGDDAWLIPVEESKKLAGVHGKGWYRPFTDKQKKELEKAILDSIKHKSDDSYKNRRLKVEMLIKQRNIGEEMDDLPKSELADEIYVFTPSSKRGIMFYSRSSRRALATGVFQTDIYSIQDADWNDHINSEEGPQVFRYRDGLVVTCTYVISEGKFRKILQEIIDSR